VALVVVAVSDSGSDRVLIGFLVGPHASTRIVHDGSSRNRAVALREEHAESRSPEAYFDTSRERAASLPAEGSSQQRIRDYSRSAHE
jgi:hypothetical protein